MRFQTDDGISDPFLFVIRRLPQILEKEDNSTLKRLKRSPSLPLVVEAQVAGNDIDLRFTGGKGRRSYRRAMLADRLRNRPDDSFDDRFRQPLLCTWPTTRGAC